MAEGTRSYAQILDSVNQLRERQERQQKQIEDAITILAQQQETARLEREAQDRKFTELLQHLSKLPYNPQLETNAHNTRNGQGFHHSREGETDDGSGGVYCTNIPDRSNMRQIKLDFSRFGGKDPAAWIYRANQYFLYHQVPPGQRIFIASFHMDNDALVWFQDASESEVFHSWEEFIQAVQVRFGSSAYDDPIEALTRLKQVHSVTAYKTEFELLSNCIKGISKRNKLSCFLSGLKDEIRLPIRMLNPSSLNDAFGLAKIQEQYVWSTKRSWRPSSSDYPQSNMGPSVLGNPKAPIVKLPYQKISESQMQERRKKGLCYFCDEKWQPGHKCSRPKVYVLDGMEIGETSVHTSEKELLVEEIHEEPESADIASISLQAMVGSPSTTTMRMVGHIHNKKVVILIDSGSTHNFVDTALVGRCGLVLQQRQALQVKVANGDVLSSGGKAVGVGIQIQGTRFVVDFFSLSLGGCDVVLGVSWLSSLGPILWDFTDLKMQFVYHGREVCFKGLTSSASTLVDDKEISMISKVGFKGVWLQLMAVENMKPQNDPCPEILQLLQKFGKVFDEHTSLPPHRARDHQINLKKDTIPVSVRPYRYPYFKKQKSRRLYLNYSCLV
ncbi:uncharacterized protein LOC109007962 [Juglans regia]|uniref:Uncharacterized protein LOC109007962 n=1 Tax=Juglans regia TaxID=51240 RepID=A0A2I4GHQ4_JUGRE|nr:uncharacterized protein LOC109007962 [Juglans regia]